MIQLNALIWVVNESETNLNYGTLTTSKTKRLDNVLKTKLSHPFLALLKHVFNRESHMYFSPSMNVSNKYVKQEKNRKLETLLLLTNSAYSIIKYSYYQQLRYFNIVFNMK